MGSFGKKIQKLSKQLIDAELVNFIASDAHKISSRRFYYERSLTIIRKRIW
ncbi:MAG: CpsB/CapC family capsule biosynthesis tyrosine phosphatase [Carnobacterium sp.]|uniref:CpsB/CapC family capsule biosynthesis tyrosine phosphatase n=1 Tax=Carnobacterium sp. TaxID=48221 RepID=UPI003314DA4E